MEKILAENVKRLCKQQDKQLKDLASDMDIDASSLTRAMYGNARLDTIEKMAVALGVSVKSLFEPMGDEAVEGFIKIRGKIYQFNSRVELENLLNCKRYFFFLQIDNSVIKISKFTYKQE